MDLDRKAHALQYLISKGFAPHQAAALVGNIIQESNVNPNAFNPKEGAYGIMQWRLDRLKALQDFAASKGVPASDLQAQLDFIGQEMRGPEAKNAQGFLSASDLTSANAALKNYIRYGDDSLNTRLQYGSGMLGQAPQATDPISGLPAYSWTPGTQATSPGTPQDTLSLASLFGDEKQAAPDFMSLLSSSVAQEQPTFLQPPPIPEPPRRKVKMKPLQAPAQSRGFSLWA